MSESMSIESRDAPSALLIRGFLASAVCGAAVLAPQATAAADTPPGAVWTAQNAPQTTSPGDIAPRSPGSAADKLAHRLEKGRPVTVDVGHDMLWSSKGAPDWDFEYKTFAPLVIGSGQNAHYYAVDRPGGGQDIHVTPIPRDAARVDDTKHLSGISYGEVVPDGSRYSVSLDRKARPWVRRSVSPALLSDVEVGRTVRAPHQYLFNGGVRDTAYDGARFASTAIAGNIKHDHSVEQITADMTKFFRQYNIGLDFGLTAGTNGLSYSSFASPGLPLAKVQALEAIDAYAKYPLDYIEGVIKTDHFVSDLRLNGLSLGGIAYSGTGETYLSIPTGLETLPHEDAHQKYQELLEIYPNLEAQWRALNPPGFEYTADSGLDCIQTQAAACHGGNHSTEGFVTAYATASVREDFAETMGYLFDTEFYAQLMSWTQTDPYLAAKVAFAKQLVTDRMPNHPKNYFAIINRKQNVHHMAKPKLPVAEESTSSQYPPVL